jgi:hypothetical protein
VRRGNGQRTRTNKVAHSTIHFQVIGREVSNTMAVLRVLDVADYGGALALGVLAW